MKLRVIDFETTGTDEKKRSGQPVGLCEIGYTNVDGATGAVSWPFSAIVNSGVPVDPEARAVHHITDEELATGITPDAALRILMDGMEPGDIFVAHQAAFEKTFFSGGTYPWICTYRCAQHIWPDLTSHGNQALRYQLGIDAEFAWPEQAMPPHRAGPDTYVTAHILARMLVERHPSQLIQLTATMPLLKTVPFGSHRGKPWSEMDRGFLEWCVDPRREFAPHQHEQIVATARHHLNTLTLSGTPFV